MKPWFIKEDNVVPFRKKDTGVVKLPNVNAYPDFLSGVQDLQNHLKRGDISLDIHKKLYQDLIHRFMKTESFETPWFLREAPGDAGGIMDLPQANKQRLDYIIRVLKDNPAALQNVYKNLKIQDTDTTTKQEPGQINPSAYLDPSKTSPEKDQSMRGLLKMFVTGIMTAEGDADDVQAFLETYGKVSYVNVKQLTNPGKQTVDNWLVGAGKVSDTFVKGLYRQLFPIKAGSRGPGEIAMALLSPQITYAPEGKGDLIINNIPVEVKGEGAKGGGRLFDERESLGTPDLNNAVYNKANIPQNLKLPFNTFTANPGHRKDRIHILDQAKNLEQAQKGLGVAFMKEMITKTYNKAPANAYNEFFSNFLQMDKKTLFNQIAKMSFLNYKQELLDKATAFKHILFVSPNASLFFALDDINQNMNQFKFQSIDWNDSRNGASAQISLL